MGHFVKHNYSNMVNQCVPHIARSPLMDVLEMLPAECVLPWVSTRFVVIYLENIYLSPF
jgi:hypothetical protein